MMYLMILGGLILLLVGGDVLVRGAVGLARKLRLSELVIGLVLVGFGTSMPELVTTLQAIGMDPPATGIAVGNVVGSNIANVFLVLGLSAVIAPVIVSPSALGRDSFVMVVLTAIFVGLVYLDLFTRPVGIVLVASLLIFVVGSLVLDRRAGSAPGEMHAHEGQFVPGSRSLVVSVLFTLAGLAGVVIGARLLVEGGVELARMVGISEAVVGLTVVAVGTSLPELATSIVAAARRKADVAVGNIIGSNIFNIAGILGITAIVRPFSVLVDEPAARSILETRSEPQGEVQMPILAWEHVGALILSVVLLVLFAFTGRKIARWEGLVLLACYVVYLGLLFDFVPTPFASDG